MLVSQKDLIFIVGQSPKLLLYSRSQTKNNDSFLVIGLEVKAVIKSSQRNEQGEQATSFPPFIFLRSNDIITMARTLTRRYHRMASTKKHALKNNKVNNDNTSCCCGNSSLSEGTYPDSLSSADCLKHPKGILKVTSSPNLLSSMFKSFTQPVPRNSTVTKSKSRATFVDTVVIYDEEETAHSTSEQGDMDANAPQPGQEEEPLCDLTYREQVEEDLRQAAIEAEQWEEPLCELTYREQVEEDLRQAASELQTKILDSDRQMYTLCTCCAVR